MSKNSNKQRYDQLKEWDRWMQNEYPNYKERKKKVKFQREKNWLKSYVKKLLLIM